MNPLHVRHVRDTLEREYRSTIDVSDLSKAPERQQTQAFLSRALAALAVQYLTGCESANAAASVIDGFDDGGYDAVMVQTTPPRLWLVQAKWSDEGNAGIGIGDAGKMRTGLEQMLNGEFDKFNSRFQAMANEVDAAIGDSNVQIVVVIALMGASKLTDRVQDAFKRILRDLNGAEQMIRLEVLGLAEFHKMVRAGAAGPRIDLDARLDSPALVPDPYKAYQGILGAETIAEWYQQYGHRMFDQNIRKALGTTDVNKGLIDTLLTKPEHFLYFNNGITLLCESIQRNARQALVMGAPVDLHLTGASIVNGAQTVACIHEAIKANADLAGRARVWARLISLEDCPDGFATDVTRATNTQNQIDLLDFVSLDENQIRLRDEFSLSLRKSYVIKRGESIPEPGTGCSVAEAAQALACTHPNLDLAIYARSDTAKLYDTSAQGFYNALFGKSTDVYRVWRSVQLLRTVKKTLEEIREEIIGRATQTAIHGDLIVSHVIARRLGHNVFKDIDHSWEADSMPAAEKLCRSILSRLVVRIDLLYPRAPIQNLFRTREKVGQLVDDILLELEQEIAEPELPAKYRQSRTEQRFNAISVIVDGKMLADGTSLEFRPGTGAQRRLFAPWLAKDPRRGRANWVNDRTRPLIWEIDKNQYSVSGLIRHMTSLLTEKSVGISQGSRRWYVAGQGCLEDIAGAGLGYDDLS